MKQTHIPYGRHEINADDIQAVVDVLKSDYLTQGPVVPLFEKALCDYTGSRYGVAANSATSALHIACLALGVTKGSLVWTSSITFVASANCARYCGADLGFVDIDPRTYNMSVEDLQTRLELASKSGRLPDVVIPVHMGGQSCEMHRIRSLSEKYGFRIIEDASHAVGGRYRHEPIGNCRYSDITVFSFHPVKIITTAEGGMALTNSCELAERMSLLRSHCVTRDEKKLTHSPDGPWYYEQIGLGFNYRMTELQAALGLSQLSRLDSFIEKRHLLANRYNLLLKELPITLPFQSPDAFSSMHLYIIRLALNKIKISHRMVFDALLNAGIGVNLHYIPVHLQPYYQGLGFKKGDFKEAERYYDEAITLPLFHHLTFEDQDKVVAAMKEILS